MFVCNRLLFATLEESHSKLKNELEQLKSQKLVPGRLELHLDNFLDAFERVQP